MASALLDVAGEEMKISAQAPPPRSPAPRRDLRRSWSTNSTGSAAPKCVCAPATHQGSFKCRLHRARALPRSLLSRSTAASAAAGFFQRERAR